MFPLKNLACKGLIVMGQCGDYILVKIPIIYGFSNMAFDWVAAMPP